VRTPTIVDVVPAILTPFAEDLAVDLPTLQNLADRLASTPGVGAIFCNGHAGEVSALSRSERRLVVEVVCHTIGRRVPVIAGIYTDSLHEAVELAQDARSAGAAATTIFPPGIFVDGGADSPEMPVLWFETIANEAETPLVIFQFSRSSGLGYTTETLSRLASLPSVVAIKEGSGDIGDYEVNFRLLSQLASPVPVLSSNNSWLLASLCVGANGILSGSSNVVAEMHVSLWRAVQKGDLAGARGISDRLYPLVRAFYKPPFIHMHTRMKEALVMMGVLPNAIVRPPLLPISAEEREEIRSALVAAELL